MNSRSILALPVTLLAVAALAAPVWASDDDDDDGDEGQTPITTPFVQSPAPAPIASPPPAAPVVAPAPQSSPPQTIVPAREHRKARKARKHSSPKRAHTPRTRVAGRKPVARAVAAVATQRTVPRGGVQAGMGGMAGAR
jgi:hypothetical protein